MGGHEPREACHKHKKDLLDIFRLLEAYPELRDRVPAEIAIQPEADLDRLTFPRTFPTKVVL